MPPTDIAEWRYFLAAFRNSHKTAGMETAAGRRIKRTGDFAGENNTFSGFFDKRIRNRYRGKECFGIGVKRI
jgi:hypothetical protein